MGIIELRQLLAGLIKESGAFDSILPLGNCVYVHADGVEYEVVLRTVRPGMAKPVTKPDHDGPVAQE